MMEDNSTFDKTVLFDTYLRGAMPVDEKTAFEARLDSEPGLREELEFHRRVMEGLVIGTENQALKRAIAGIRREMPEREPGNTISVKFIVILLLSVAAGVWYFWTLPVPPPPPIPVPVPAENDSQNKSYPIPSHTAPPPVADTKSNDAEKSVSPIVSKEKPVKTGPQPVDEIKAGASNPGKVQTGSIPLKMLVVRDGKTIQNADIRSVQLELYRDKATESKCRFSAGKLKIYTPKPDDFSLAALEISELQETDGSVRFFLKSGTIWYQIFSHGKTAILEPLEPEEDETLLRLLNGI